MIVQMKMKILVNDDDDLQMKIIFANTIYKQEMLNKN